MSSFQLCGKFRGAPVIARPEYKIEKLFEGWRMAWRAAQDRFEQANRFLRQTVAGKQIHIGERLRDEFLCFCIERFVHYTSGRYFFFVGRRDIRPELGSLRLRNFGL